MTPIARYAYRGAAATLLLLGVGYAHWHNIHRMNAAFSVQALQLLNAENSAGATDAQFQSDLEALDRRATTVPELGYMSDLRQLRTALEYAEATNSAKQDAFKGELSEMNEAAMDVSDRVSYDNHMDMAKIDGNEYENESHELDLWRRPISDCAGKLMRAAEVRWYSKTHDCSFHS